MMEQYITARAQATARAAAVNNWTAANVQNYLVYNSISAPGAQGGGSTSGLMGLLTSQVSYATLGTSGTADYRLQVTVSGVPAFQWIPFIAGSYTLPKVVATIPAQSLGLTN